jgi:hypothetical protein
MDLTRPTVPGNSNPNYGAATNSFNQAQRTYQQSPQSFDNAAARVRARVQGQTTGNENQIRNTFAGRGTSNSGMMQNQLARNRQAGQGAYAQGLTDLENTFEQSRLASAQGLSNIGSNFANMANAQNQNQIQSQGLADQFSLGAGGIGAQIRGQDIEQLLGLKGYDVQTAGQNIQKSLGEQSNYKDILGTLLQFGNANLGTNTPQVGWRDQIMNYFSGGLG